MNEPADAEAAWRAFMFEPLNYIHPSRLAGSLGGEINDELCISLRSCERLRDRLSALIIARAECPAFLDLDTVDPQDRAVAIAPPEDLSRIAVRAGAIVWSRAMANAVRGQDVAALEAALGAELCRFAIKHRALAGPEKPLEPFDTLLERITAEGWRCYAAWCAAMPHAVGARAHLKIPGEAFDGSAEAPFLENSVEIVRRATWGGENA